MSQLPSTAPAVRPPRFSQELDDMAKRFAGQPVSIAALLAETRGRGYNLLLVIIALPFLTPIPLPGFSIPFGVVVAFVGMRLALGQKPSLPARLLAKELPPGFLTRLLAGASRVVRFLELWLRPRLPFLHDQLLYRRVAGLLICISGLYLVLPLPIPFSNGLPGWTVLLLSAAALERDGVCYLAGCVMFVVATAYFVALAFGGVELFDQLRQWLAHRL